MTKSPAILSGATLTRLQLAFFISGSLTKSRAEIFIDIKKALDNVFDVEPTIMPIPPNPPENFPLLELNSKTRQYVSRLTTTRADLFWNVLKEEISTDFASQISSQTNKFDTFFKYISSLFDIHRIGYIADFFILTDNPSHTIKSKFLSTELKNKTFSEANIRFNILKAGPGELRLNDITIIDTAKTVSDKKDGIHIQRDINSVSETQYHFDYTLYKQFRDFAERSFAPSEIQNILEF